MIKSEINSSKTLKNLIALYYSNDSLLASFVVNSKQNEKSFDSRCPIFFAIYCNSKKRFCPK